VRNVGKIRGWGNYYRHVVSKQTFSYVDHKIFEMIFQWAKRRHPNKSITWIRNKYFHTNTSRWEFKGQTKRASGDIVYHKRVFMDAIPIRRHIKIKCDANPYDPAYAQYFAKRKIELRRNTWKNLPETAL
jgi:RNA-directed DNA polymerase